MPTLLSANTTICQHHYPSGEKAGIFEKSKAAELTSAMKNARELSGCHRNPRIEVLEGYKLFFSLNIESQIVLACKHVA